MYHKRLTLMPDYWANSVDKFPQAAAAIWQGETYTYSELDGVIGRLAGYLREEAGVAAGDRVAVAMPNCLECLTTYWATLRVGAVIAPVNIRLRNAELEFVLDNIAPKAICVHSDTPDAVLGAVEDSGDIDCVIRAGEQVDGMEGVAYERAAGYERPAETWAEIEEDDPAILLHTSGTTGQPKGAIMTHRTLQFNVKNAVFAHSFRHEDIHLLAIPFFAPTASYSLLTSSAYLGSCICIAPRPDAGTIVGLIREHRCTTFISVPTMLHLFITHPEIVEAELDSLRLIAYSGSPMPVRTIERLRERFGDVSLHNFFGLTETISITHVLPSANAADHAESVGKPLPEIFTRIVDEHGQEVARGETGELCFGRDNIIPGYWRRPGLLDESVEGDWFHTGDLGRIDEDGFLYVQGRSKDMVIVAGQNVYALEVEKVIYQHPQVREAAVIGVPATGVRSALGELVKAFVVPQPEEELTQLQVKQHCSERLPSYKVPQVVEFMERLPRNAAGKVLKRELR